MLEYDYYSLTFFAFYKHEYDEVGSDVDKSQSAHQSRVSYEGLSPGLKEGLIQSTRRTEAKRNEKLRKHLKML